MGSSLILFVFIILFGLVAYGIWRAYSYSQKLKQAILTVSEARGWTYEAGPTVVIEPGSGNPDVAGYVASIGDIDDMVRIGSVLAQNSIAASRLERIL
jgi:hypothetical protein